MHIFEMVAIIAVVSIIAGVIKSYLDNKVVNLDAFESRLDKVEKLEERVRILEAIVTDKGYDLKAEIDNLK